MDDDVQTATVPACGFADEKFAEVRDIFERRLSDGTEVGASVAVSIDGEMVVDLWGGYADGQRTRPWEKDTLVNIYSVSKTMMAVTALMLADRGVIDFDARVASYWPEFAQAGKGDIKVSHLMAHSSGLSGWRETLDFSDLYDWEKCTTLLARQEPFWEPGTAPGYHAVTQGYLVGEVVRRATGEMLGDIFRREIAEPLGADIYLGLPASELHRVSPMIDEKVLPTPTVPPSELMINAFTNPMLQTGLTEITGTAEWTGSQVYAGNGQGNGRSIATVHALMANGGEVNGKRIISEAGCRKALELQVEGHDLVIPIVISRFGMGFGLSGEALEMPNPECLYWPGSGGALTAIDMRNRMSFGYAMNQRGGAGVLVDPRARDLVNATWNAIAS